MYNKLILVALLMIPDMTAGAKDGPKPERMYYGEKGQ